jgi:hypothetical protein
MIHFCDIKDTTTTLCRTLHKPSEKNKKVVQTTQQIRQETDTQLTMPPYNHELTGINMHYAQKE